MHEKSMAEEKPDALASRLILTRLPMVFSVLVFGFGLAAGILLAFSSNGLQDSAGLIVSVFLVLIGCTLILGAAVFLFRKPLWRRVFGVAESHLEQFAVPLARVAQFAAERDPTGAVKAAGELVQLGLARYAWLSTRRWVLASLTGLIAAMAALSGTALLFRQNQLIEVQSQLLSEQNVRIGEQTELLSEQNVRIVEQTVLLEQQVELAEAARNAELAVEITNIAAALGEAADRALSGEDFRTVNVLDPETDLSRALILRITSISRALKPYRFLDTGARAGDPSDRMRVAMQRRRHDLPTAYARMATYNGWSDPDGQTHLIDRPTSPERGQLLSVLVTGGVRNLETFGISGLDLSYAHLPSVDLGVFTAQLVNLAVADFTGGYLSDIDFGGATLENARFVRGNLLRCDFSVLDSGRVRTPIRAGDAPFPTLASGADFSDAYIGDSSFSGAWLLAANFDGALVVATSFAGAELGPATFQGAVLVGVDFTGAGLKSTDLDGAIVFGDDALDRIAAQAQPDSFVRDRWVAEPIPLDQVMQIPLVYNKLEREFLEAAGPSWRLRRVKPFEDTPPPEGQ
jgi:uncharacterized protein YjbI with pentapeptide repeats